MSAKTHKLVISWLPIAFAITVACAAAYGVGQQVLRQSANDPQVGMAENAATRLLQGEDPLKLVGQSVDVTQSASPALQIYDQDNKLIASSIVANSQGRNITIPQGVLNHARNEGQDEVTWVPDDTRLAAVAVATGSRGDVVVAVRSLKHVENRIEHLGKMVLAGWLVALAASLALQWFVRKLA